VGGKNERNERTRREKGGVTRKKGRGRGKGGGGGGKGGRSEWRGETFIWGYRA